MRCAPADALPLAPSTREPSAEQTERVRVLRRASFGFLYEGAVSTAAEGVRPQARSSRLSQRGSLYYGHPFGERWRGAQDGVRARSAAQGFKGAKPLWRRGRSPLLLFPPFPASSGKGGAGGIGSILTTIQGKTYIPLCSFRYFFNSRKCNRYLFKIVRIYPIWQKISYKFPLFSKKCRKRPIKKRNI